jgi:hypothetical protein
VLGRFRARSLQKIDRIGVHLVSLPDGASEIDYVRTLRARDDVEFAELDRLVPVSDLTPNDPGYASEWHLPRISAPAAWSTTTGSNSVIVAVIDTGVDGTHEDLASKMVAGWNFYDNNSNTSDAYGHGTKTAGTIAAATNNGTGISGICWNCWIMPLRISDPTGYASYSSMSSAIIWAADHGAKVANLSFAIDSSATITSAAAYLNSKGGVLAVSAGNSSAFDAAGNNTNMLRVSATDPNDALYSWSNTGNNIDLAAPGCVYTTASGGGYTSACGTSYSAPVVSGVAALVFSVKPNLTAAEVTQILTQSADDVGPVGWDTSFGWGRVNAAKAVALAQNSIPADTVAPSVSFMTPTQSATVSGVASVQMSATDNVGVAMVMLSADGAFLNSWSGAPYTYSWNTTGLGNGTHTLTAAAKDAAGNTTTSTVQVTVNNVVADTQPPALSFATPGNGGAVSGTTTVQIAASDNVGVVLVTLAIDGASAASWSGGPYTYSWNTKLLPNGTHTLSATAKDSAGNTSTATIQVTVSNPVVDATPPTVSIVSPKSGSIASSNSTIVQASVYDNVGVVKVDLYVDGALTATSTSAPFSTRWNTKKMKGTHTLQLKAYDAAGNMGVSAVVTVTF